VNDAPADEINKPPRSVPPEEQSPPSSPRGFIPTLHYRRAKTGRYPVQAAPYVVAAEKAFDMLSDCRNACRVPLQSDCRQAYRLIQLTGLLPLASCFLLLASCFLPLASCLLPTTTARRGAESIPSPAVRPSETAASRGPKEFAAVRRQRRADSDRSEGKAGSPVQTGSDTFPESPA